MKLKQKLILDGILLVLLVLLMDYSGTGGLLHELLGSVMLAGLLVHVAINRKYYGAMFRAIKRNEAGLKSKAAFVINIILPVTALLMLVSSLAISRDLLPGVAALFGSELWVPVHIACATVLLICVFLHVCMHAEMIGAFISRHVGGPSLQVLKRAGMRIAAFLFALFVIKSSFSNMADAAGLLPSPDRESAEYDPESRKQSSELIIEEKDTGVQDGTLIEIGPEPEPEEPVSLEAYLGSLHCTGCGRHCSLLAPRCGRGENQASQAASEYYETYGGQSV